MQWHCDMKVKKDYYSDGQLKAEYVFKKGELIFLLGYHQNGRLWEQVSFKGGRQNGLSRIFDQDGNPREEWSYKNGRLNGISRRYYDNGLLREEREYRDDCEIWRKEYDRQGCSRSESIFEEATEIKLYYH